ncbi:hypothetical protein C4564_02250 [Candidatus Microgenomates bacterium]|nr:MAG: hypothetical protein C4564_02250 [Candidatus Microgenomates bacterium]
MESKHQSLKELLPKFIKSLEEKKRSPSTILAYRADIEQLIDYLLQKNASLPENVKPIYLESFRDYLLMQKYTPKSASRKLNAVKTFFRWLRDEKIISRDPSKDVSHPIIENSIPKFLSPLEYRSLRDIVRGDTRVAAIVELVLQAGIRISEVANLKLNDIKNDSVRIAAYATQPERVVPINQPAREAIDAYLKERRGGVAINLFVSKNGKPLAIRNIRASIDRYMQKADVPQYSINDLRNTFIIENLKRGVDIVTVSQVAGHKRLSTTERYVELAGLKETGKKQKLEEL